MRRVFVAALAAAAVACGPGDEARAPGSDAALAQGAAPESLRCRRTDPSCVDPPPVITVASPAPEALARPWVTVSATCTDGAKRCASFTVQVNPFDNPAPVLTGTQSVSGKVDLSAYEGQMVDLVFTGIDRARQVSRITRRVYVESSSRLGVVATVPGPIWDYANGRILFVDMTGSTPVLRIRDTTTGTTEDVEAGAGAGYGYLTSSGALYARDGNGDARSTYPYCWVHERRDGVTVDLGGLNSCYSLRVAGSYAVFSTQSVVNGPMALVRRDLGAGTNTEIGTAAGNWMNDVAANGDVVYWGNDYNVYRWREALTAALTGDSPTFWNTYPVTDGVSVVYRKTNPADWTHALVLDDGQGEIELRGAEAGDPSPPWDYTIANGWIAYTRAGAVWRRSSGGDEQLTSFGTGSAIDIIAPDGTVLLSSGSRRYRAVPGMALQEIGSRLGTIVYRAGAFYDVVGGSVLEVNP